MTGSTPTRWSDLSARRIAFLVILWLAVLFEQDLIFPVGIAGLLAWIVM